MPLIPNDLVEPSKEGLYHAARGLGMRADNRSATENLAAIREYVVGGGFMHKMFRPWDIAPQVLDRLDSKEPWWGFEFETGWSSRDNRSQAIGFAWDNFDGVMFDSEGEGRYPVEITFMPAEQSKFLNGTAAASQFIEWMAGNPDLIYNSQREDVGCHWNYSHPLSRESYGVTMQLRRFLRNTLYWLMEKNGQRKELFGRETLYGVCYANQSGVNNCWLEFKTFRTPYDTATYHKYLSVCKALSDCAELFLSMKPEARGALYDSSGVSNLYSMVTKGEDPIIRPTDQMRMPAHAARLSARDYGR